MVVVILETWTTNWTFQAFIDDLASKDRLSRIVYNEAYLAVLESKKDFRLWTTILGTRPRGIPRIFMSATLLLEVRTELTRIAKLD